MHMLPAVSTPLVCLPSRILQPIAMQSSSTAAAGRCLNRQAKQQGPTCPFLHQTSFSLAGMWSCQTHSYRAEMSTFLPGAQPLRRS